MEKRLQEQHADMFSLYQRMVTTTNGLKQDMSNKDDDLEFLANVSFAMNELDKLLKDVGVIIRKTKEMADRLACKQWMVEQTGEPIRTEYVTATPDVKLQPKMPKKGSDELHELLDWLGVKENHDVVRIHWPTLCDIVTKRMSEGQPLPPGMTSGEFHNPSATLKLHKRKDVTD